jgi:hypothetical protein
VIAQDQKSVLYPARNYPSNESSDRYEIEGEAGTGES